MTDLSGSRILVTGGAGFLGRFVAGRLEERGAEVIIPRRQDHDLTRQDRTEALLEAVRPDVVVHLAAEVGGIGANRVSPGRFFYANAVMGINVIEAARTTGVSKFVQVGTVCSYPKLTQVPFREESLWDGYPEETNAPYGIAKKALWVMLGAYREQYDFNGIYLMPANLYGPFDNFDTRTSHVIPALVRRFSQARDDHLPAVDVWGTGKASREFLYVEDAAEAIVLATERYDGPDPVNIGTGREVTIESLVGLIADRVGFRGEIRWDTSKPDGQPRRALDTSRARQLFGFEAQTSLEDGLDRTVGWWDRQRGD